MSVIDILELSVVSSRLATTRVLMRGGRLVIVIVRLVLHVFYMAHGARDELNAEEREDEGLNETGENFDGRKRQWHDEWNQALNHLTHYHTGE